MKTKDMVSVEVKRKNVGRRGGLITNIEELKKNGGHYYVLQTYEDESPRYADAKALTQDILDAYTKEEYEEFAIFDYYFTPAEMEKASSITELLMTASDPYFGVYRYDEERSGFVYEAAQRFYPVWGGDPEHDI